MIQRDRPFALVFPQLFCHLILTMHSPCPPPHGDFFLSHGAERRENRIGVRVIGGIPGNMAENDAPPGVDNEYPRQLPDIADGPADAMALGHGGQGLEGDGRRKEVQGGCHFKAKGLV